MPQITPDQEFGLVNAIYNSIFGSVTGGADLSGQPVQTGDETLLTLCPSYSIRAEDFTDPYFPGYTTTDPAALAHAEDSLQNIAALTDTMPQVNSLWLDSGQQVSKGYEDVLKATVTAPAPDPKIKAQYDDAQAYLYTTKQIVNPVSGNAEPCLVASDAYAAYLVAETNYNRARMSYIAAYNNYQATVQGQTEWPLVEPMFRQPVDDASNAWDGAYKIPVETALAVMATSGQNVVSAVFKEAHDTYAQAPLAIGVGAEVLQTIILPTDWTEDTAGWIGVTVNQGDTTTTTTSDLTAVGGGLGFTYGIFSIGADGAYSDQHNHFHSTSSSLAIYYEYLTTHYQRGWLNFDLLLLPDWTLAPLEPGSLSAGTKDATAQENKLWPLMPAGFVAARNVAITASWSKQDEDLINEAINAGGTLSIGPFHINGSYKHTKSNDTKTASWDGSTLRVPGMQILGFINRIVPFAPPAPPAPAPATAPAPAPAITFFARWDGDSGIAQETTAVKGDQEVLAGKAEA